jgi:hypothetical protein
VIRNFTSTTGAGLEPEPLTNLKPGAGAAPKIGRLRIPGSKKMSAMQTRYKKLSCVLNVRERNFTLLKETKKSLGEKLYCTLK